MMSDLLDDVECCLLLDDMTTFAVQEFNSVDCFETPDGDENELFAPIPKEEEQFLKTLKCEGPGPSEHFDSFEWMQFLQSMEIFDEDDDESLLGACASLTDDKNTGNQTEEFSELYDMVTKVVTECETFVPNGGVPPYQAWLEKVQAFPLYESCRAFVFDQAKKVVGGAILDSFTSELYDQLINVFETTSMMVYSLTKCSDIQGLIFVLVMGYKMLTRRNVLGDAIELVTKITDLVKSMFTPSGDHLQSGYGCSSFEEFIDSCRQMLKDYKNVVESPLVKKIKSIFMYILSFGVFESFGISFEKFRYDELEAAYVKRKHTSTLDFVLSVFDGLTFIIQRGMQALKSGSMLPLVHSEETYVKWIETAQRLEEDSHKLMNATAAGVDLHQFTKDLDECITEGESIVKFADKGKEKLMLCGLLRSLRIIRCVRLTRKFAQEEREVPYSVVVHGDSSVGKSKFKEFLFYLYGKAFDLPLDDRFKYTRCPDDEYWSGFDSGVWFLVLDDIALLNPNKTLNDPSTSIVIPVVNGIPYNPPMAIAEEKGTCSLRVKFVVATTNQKDLNARVFYNCPLAVLRRFKLFIELRVNKDFRDPRNPTMLDQAKAAACQDEWPNYWDIYVTRVVPTAPKPGETLCGYEFQKVFDGPIDIYTFGAFIVENAKAFKMYQDADVNSTQAMRGVQMCLKCIAPMSRCRCVEKVQAWSDEESDSETEASIDAAILDNVREFKKTMRYSFDGRNFPLNTSKHQLNDETDAMFCERLKTLKGFLAIQRQMDQSLPAFDDVTEEQIDSALYDAYAPWCYSRAETISEWFSDKMDLVVAIAKFTANYVSDGVSRISHCLMEKTSLTVAWLCTTGIKLQVAEMGRAAMTKLSDPRLRVLALCLAGVATGWATWKLFFSHPEIVQGNVTSKDVGTPPVVRGDEKENVWKTNELMCHPVDLGAQTQSMKGMSSDEFVSRYGQHIIHLIVHYEINGQALVSAGTAICTGGHLCVTDNHIFRAGATSYRVEMIVCPREPGISKNTERTFLERDLDRVCHKDLVFFQHDWPSMKNIRGFFPQTTLNGASFSGRILIRRAGGFLDSLSFAQAHRLIHKVDALNITLPVWEAKVPVDTIDGDCGSIYLTTGFPTILGLHQIGSPGRACAIEVLQSDIADAMERFRSVIVEPGCPQTEATKIGKLHFKSPLLYVEEGRGIIHGSLIGTHRSSFTSKVEKTLMHDEAEAAGFHAEVGKPQVTQNGWKPKRHGLMPVVSQKSRISTSILRECADAYVDEVLEMLPKAQLDELKIVDNLTAINGMPGVKFIDAMKRRTSMGFPYHKSKRFFIEPLPENDTWSDGVDFTPEIYEEVERIWKCYQEGKRSYPVFTSVLKDEVLAKKKIDIEKLRVFSVGPGPWSLVVRKLLITFVRVFQNNPYTFEGAPGMNCCSDEWKVLHDYLVSFGEDMMVAGDFKAFDKGAEPVMVREAFYCIRRVLEKAGWSEDELRMIDCVSEDVAYPLTNFFGDLITFMGSNPSGQPLTVIVNCIINSLYMRYVMKVSNPQFDLRQFKKSVHLITYGDDNTMGVSKSVGRFYNHSIIQNVLATIGVEYTMADKTTASVPFINIKDITFLKRSWRWEPEVAGGSWMAPLDWESVNKMMTWWVKSDFVCAEDHAEAIFASVIREAFQYGHKRFNETTIKLQHIADKIGLVLSPGVIPTWDQCCDGYEEGALSLSPAQESENIE